MNRTGNDYRIPVHLFVYWLLLYKNETLITIHAIHMQKSGRVFCNLAKNRQTQVTTYNCYIRGKACLSRIGLHSHTRSCWRRNSTPNQGADPPMNYQMAAFPKTWNIAEATPIPKEGNPEEPARQAHEQFVGLCMTYPPFSLVSFLGSNMPWRLQATVRKSFPY